MKKNKKTQAENKSRFGGLIRQMHQSKMVLVNLTQAVDFVDECGKRGILVGIGDHYKDGLVIYKK